MARGKPTRHPTAVETDTMTDEELEALLNEVPDDAPEADLDETAEVDLDEEYERTMRPVVPAVRVNVTRTVQNPPNTPAPKPQTPLSIRMDYFQEVVENNDDLEQAFDAVFMVGKLIENIYSFGNPVCKKLGFNEENIHKLFQAMCTSIKGAYVSEEDINKFLTKRNHTLRSVIFSNLLDLNEYSTNAEIEQKANELSEKMKRFKDLLRFRQRLLVDEVLVDISKDGELEDGRNRGALIKAALDIAEANGFTGEEIPPFDEKEIARVLAEAQGQPIPEDVPKTGSHPEPERAPEAPQEEELNYAEFYTKNQTQPALLMLRRLHQALKNSDEFETRYKDRFFEGDKAENVVDWLNKCLEGLGSTPSLGLDLLLASEEADTHALLQIIGEGFQMTDSKSLKVKLEEIHQVINQRYPKLAPAVSAPAPQKPAQPSPAEAHETAFDYQALYEGLAEKPIALSRLFHTLRCDPQYYDRFYRSHLKGDSRLTLKQNIDQILGSGMALALQEAAQRPDANAETALIQVIAESYPVITNNPPAIEKVLRQINAALGATYPQLLS